MPSWHGGVGRVASGSRSEATPTGQRFPRTCRLTSRRQFLEVYDQGRKVRRACFTIFGLANDLGEFRLGVTVTRRVGHAVTRNRIKRKLREAFRRQRERLAGSLDLVINANRSILEADPTNLERELLGAVTELVRRERPRT